MRISLFTIFRDGGPFMWPILLLSVAAAAIIIERIVSHIIFYRKIDALIIYVKSKGKTSAPEIEGLDDRLFRLAPDKMVIIIQEISQSIFDKMSGIIELLTGIGNIAPLLGFIGTVSGMIIAFQSIAASDKVTVKLVAGGISQALITTGFGLIVAVICLFAEQIFRFNLVSRANRLEEEVNLFVREMEAEKGAYENQN